MRAENIRNFAIIAHIDHGKSTLADRLLELTGTVHERDMQEQVLDSMELERERGITIKMAPVRMRYTLGTSGYTLNLIDTPGHIDFSYEVSRALTAVEGVVLLVDATQGVQAQTLSTIDMARRQNLVIIPVLNKIDLASACVDETAVEIMSAVGCDRSDILSVSAKTGDGVSELLSAIIEKIPAPDVEYPDRPRALVFDFEYSAHKGVVVYVRMTDGSAGRNDEFVFSALGKTFSAHEIGVFTPEETPVDTLYAGEIGYIVTGVKNAGLAAIGDTLVSMKDPLPRIAGYARPEPVVWASLYPESADDFALLRQALDRLHLEDSALQFDEDDSSALGRGFKCGFLGLLHLEIITERLRREFNLDFVIASPTIHLTVFKKNGSVSEVYSPNMLPESYEIVSIKEPWIEARIVTPIDTTGNVVQLLYSHEAELKSTEQFSAVGRSGGRNVLTVEMPLRELMRNFFDELKSVSSGYASLDYKIKGSRTADIARLDILIAGELEPAFSRMVGTRRTDEEAKKIVGVLKESIPRAQFPIKIQAKANGRIIASRTIPAMRKDVTSHLYGGDITRKMKLLKKQKKGKKRLKAQGRVEIPSGVFVRVVKEV